MNMIFWEGILCYSFEIEDNLLVGRHVLDDNLASVHAHPFGLEIDVEVLRLPLTHD